MNFFFIQLLNSSLPLDPSLPIDQHCYKVATKRKRALDPLIALADQHAGTLSTALPWLKAC
jgi:hypothetical protein